MLLVPAPCGVAIPGEGLALSKQVPHPAEKTQGVNRVGPRKAGGGAEGRQARSSLAPVLRGAAFSGGPGGVDCSPTMYSSPCMPCHSSQGCRLGRGSLQSPQPHSGGGRPAMDSMRTSLLKPHPPAAPGSAPLSSASPLSWLSPSPSTLGVGPKR